MRGGMLCDEPGLGKVGRVLFCFVLLCCVVLMGARIVAASVHVCVCSFVV